MPEATYDVAVIGGGIAGMAVAALLGVDRSVVVLEREDQLAYHSSGRSVAAFLESYGTPAIRALTRASRPLFDDALLSPRRMLWVGQSQHVGAIEEVLAAEPVLRPVDEAEARVLCPAFRPGWIAAAAAEDGAQDIDVAGLFQQYRREALHHGVTVHTGAPLVSAARSNGRWLVRTPTESVRASVIVNAAGAWADEVAVTAGVAPLGLTPLRRTVAVVTAPTVDRSWPLVCHITDDFYFRPEGDGLLISPADETPSPPCDARPATEDVALAIERVNEATTLGLRHVRTAWAGLRTFSPDHDPVVGYDPAVDGFFWLAALGGYGMQTAPAMAHLAAALVRNEPPPASLSELAPAALTPGR